MTLIFIHKHENSIIVIHLKHSIFLLQEYRKLAHKSKYALVSRLEKQHKPSKGMNFLRGSALKCRRAIAILSYCLFQRPHPHSTC